MTGAAAIVIPLKRQHDAWLDQCVQSALAQTVPCEVIVVRSRKTPAGNLRVLKHLGARSTRLRVLIEPTPDSFAGALNHGIRAAHASRIGFLLSDDWLQPEAVARCLRRSADIVCTGLTVYYDDGATVQEGIRQTLAMARYRALASLEAKAAYLQHFFLFQREALARVGGVDETLGNYAGVDDYDLVWTLLEKGASVEIVEKRLYNYRDHGGERLMLADKAHGIRSLEKIFRKHKVPVAERRRLIADQSRWFGRTLREVVAEDLENRAGSTRARRQ